jgi:hypothetical protein
MRFIYPIILGLVIIVTGCASKPITSAPAYPKIPKSITPSLKLDNTTKRLHLVKEGAFLLSNLQLLQLMEQKDIQGLLIYQLEVSLLFQ